MNSHPPLKTSNGFTLVEMLVVITIIVILAALSVGGFQYVLRKQDEEKTKIQIALLERGLEEYKLSTGSYPPVTTSNELYQKLYWEGASTSPPGEIFTPELAPADPNSDETNKQGWIEGTGASAEIVDPWGNEYIVAIPGTINPDFDILSMGPDGQTGSDEFSADDISNY